MRHSSRKRPARHLECYERVTFDKAYVRGGPGEPNAAIIAPGHPLLAALIDLVSESYASVLNEGTVLIADDANFTSPRLLAIVERSADRLEERHARREGLQTIAESEAAGTNPGAQAMQRIREMTGA